MDELKKPPPADGIADAAAPGEISDETAAEPETEALGPEAEDTEPEAEDTEPEAEDTEPETENTEPETEDSAPETEEAAEPAPEASDWDEPAPSDGEQPEAEAPADETPGEEPEWSSEEPAPEPARVCVADIHFRDGGKTYFFDPDGLELKAGDHVIIDTARGAEYGTCAVGNHIVRETEIVAPLRKVLRAATPQDEKIAAANHEKEKRAFQVCLQKIEEHKLDMQLVSAECAFDGSKLLFFFTADGRVDFRELVKNLASVFRTRIELRQIGVRDKAKMVGGLGVCGRPFCCSQFLDDFQPVSIKMAKTQNLSLNPTKISGTCGRLMCCLKYEQEAYEELLKTAPKPESFVDTVDGRGTVCDVNLLRQTVRVRMENSPDTIGCYHNCDVCVLRNGKARKTDPPIPSDLAPISSQPRPARRPEPEKTEKADEMSALFKNMDEYAAAPFAPAPEQPETPPQAAAPSAPPAPSGQSPAAPRPEGQSRRRRRRGGQRPGNGAQPAGNGAPSAGNGAPSAAPAQQSAPQREPSAAVPDGSKPRSSRRRPRRRPQNPNPGGQTPPPQES